MSHERSDQTPIDSPVIDPTILTSEGVLKEVSKRSFLTDTVTGTGPYQAIVLDAWPEQISGSADTSAWGSTQVITVNRIRARIIKEYSDAHIRQFPAPEKLPIGDVQMSESDRYKINMHPVYTCKNGTADQPLPSVGSRVWVDYARIGSGGPDGLGQLPEYWLTAETVLAGETGGTGGPPSSKGAFLFGHRAASVGSTQTPQIITPLGVQAHGSTVQLISPAPVYKENRVRLYSYAKLNNNSPLLVSVASTKPANSIKSKLHVLAADRFNAMNQAFKKEMKGVIPNKYLRIGFRVQSGTRPQWPREGASFEEYRKAIIRRYKKQFPGSDEYTFRKGSAIKAFNSPHQTGLAIDLRFLEGGRLMHSGEGASKTVATQKKMKVFQWLKLNAHRFGFSPLYHEPWHWEVLIPRANFFSGEEFAPLVDGVRDYNVKVVETSTSPYPINVTEPGGRFHSVKGKKLATDDRVFAFSQFG